MRILITGGTGTFGHAVAPLLLSRGDVVTIFSRDEQKQEAMQVEFESEQGRYQTDNNPEPLRFFLGDVRDRPRLAMAMHRQDACIHAAALKIVPKGEFDPSEFKKTNIDGTDNVIHAALEAGVGKAILLSTDKAVAPINLYGATKLAAEKLFIAGNNYRGAAGTSFSVVRYGNVMGSRGSVLLSWMLAANAGKPLQITDPRMTRFWLTKAEAAAFVLQALEHMTGGEVFIPRMPSFRLVDLAEAVHWASRNIYKPNINIVGIRPGEKLHEDLITSHEAPQTHVGEHVYVICPLGIKPEAPLAAPLTSSNNTDWLAPSDLQERLRHV